MRVGLYNCYFFISVDSWGEGHQFVICTTLYVCIFLINLLKVGVKTASKRIHFHILMIRLHGLLFGHLFEAFIDQIFYIDFLFGNNFFQDFFALRRLLPYFTFESHWRQLCHKVLWTGRVWGAIPGMTWRNWRGLKLHSSFRARLLISDPLIFFQDGELIDLCKDNTLFHKHGLHHTIVMPVNPLNMII